MNLLIEIRLSSRWLFAAALALSAGCAQMRLPETQLRPLDSRPQYASVAITYQLQSAPAASATGQVQLASYARPAASGRMQILSIEYPHPSGRRGYALAEVIVSRDPSAAANDSQGMLAGFRRLARDRMPGLTYAEGIESAWALDVPAAQVDLVVGQLAAQGYFKGPATADARVELSARINGQGVSKPWSAVPELNTLVRNVRRQGKLVSHREPLQLASLRAGEGVIVAAPTSRSPVDVAPIGTSAVLPAVYVAPAGPSVAALPTANTPGVDVTERLPPVE